MIADVTSSGAGSAPDPNYQVAVRLARAAGIRVLGYADTNYSRRPAWEVRADIRHYQEWYGIINIFLDQVSSDDSKLPYYSALASYVHGRTPGSMVMLNPGTYPDQGYLSVGDVVLVFEGSYASYLKLRAPGWAQDYPAVKFAHAIYATSGSELASALSLSRQRNAGYVYVTGGTGPNPYSSLPAYWSSEDATIAAGCPDAGRRPGAR